MSVAKDLRRFMVADPAITITQIEEGTTSELYVGDNGFIWFGRNSTQRMRTFDQPNGTVPEEQNFDIEIYHPDPDVVEAHALAIHEWDCYHGAFGNATVQGIFVDTQSDDYIPRVNFTDAEKFDSAFFSLEIRSYR